MCSIENVMLGAIRIAKVSNIYPIVCTWGSKIFNAHVRESQGYVNLLCHGAYQYTVTYTCTLTYMYNH